eukprot:scaffold7317_cov114-Cylindrotheca_fusiformis.AAC.1
MEPQKSRDLLWTGDERIAVEKVKKASIQRTLENETKMTTIPAIERRKLQDINDINCWGGSKALGAQSATKTACLAMPAHSTYLHARPSLGSKALLPRPRRDGERTNAKNKTSMSRATSAGSKPPLYKIVMLGDSGVGKTSLVARLTNPERPLNHDISATMGIEFDTQMLDTEHGKVKAQIWDTAGQERFAR